MTVAPRASSVQVHEVPNPLPRILERAGDDLRFREQLERAGVLIVPWEDYKNVDGPVFPPETDEVFEYLREQLPESIPVDLAVKDEDYRELGLHGELLFLPTLMMLVGAEAQVSLTINLLSNYVYDWAKRFRSRENGTVKSQVLINAEAKTISITYEGPPGAFQETMKEAIRAALNTPADHGRKARR